MFLVDSKRLKTVIPTTLTYTSSQNVFHDITNNGIDYGSIIAPKNGRLIDHATWRRFTSLQSRETGNCETVKKFFKAVSYLGKP